MRISRNFLLMGLLTLAIITSFISCHKKDKTVALVGNWIEKPDFMGDARHEAVAFTIGEVGYVGTGYNGDNRLNDFYAYDAEHNFWTGITTPPAEFVARTGAVAFSINGKGYVGTGRDNTKELSDFWVYDPGENTWNSIADFPLARYGAVAFAINDTGYVGTGYNGNTLLDFYKYNSGTDSWKAIANYPSKVREAVAFVLDNKGYVCTGEKNGVAIDDFYAYNQEKQTWDTKRKISNVSDESYDDDYSIIRLKAVAFAMNGKGYITTGEYSGFKNDVWEYDPATDLWVERTGFEGTVRSSAVAFTTASGRGFITTGVNGASAYYDDLFEFKPLDEYNEDD